ncbi:hypothetical protein BJF85_20145 [Saccharomonospora sp. CUA-673]|uniref:hypothetical protein n=1 Tax=Saccharomonospora sp. CUA-673 TaxID=1904969 RepID=UPI0009628C49|nr:hypothetical protein [Saccharomonospora sp. CUA-673]OLT44195.1 hypothetical protein BJF85_20145 [Saccharomonospora sp. CUA-673]
MLVHRFVGLYTDAAARKEAAWKQTEMPGPPPPHVVGHALQNKPFTWMRVAPGTHPSHVDAVARQFGATVVRSFGHEPDPSFMLISRVPIRSIRDTTIPTKKPFRSMRRLTVSGFLTAVSLLIAILATGFMLRIGDSAILPTMLIVVGTTVPSAVLGLWLQVRKAGPSLDHRMSALINEFDGRDKVRIFAIPYLFPGRSIYAGVAWDLGYTFTAYTRPWVLSSSGEFGITTLTFERRAEATSDHPPDDHL